MLKRILIPILCILLCGCSKTVKPKEPDVEVVNTTLKIEQCENIDSINNTMTELYVDIIDFVRIQDGQLLFILNDKSHNHNYTTKALYAYNLTTYESRVVVPLTNSRRVTDFCLSNQFGVFNMNFDEYYRLDYDAIHTYVGHTANYTKMPPLLVADQIYTYLSENDHQQLATIQTDGTYTVIGEVNGYLEPTLCKASKDTVYYVGANIVYIYNNNELKSYEYSETITNTMIYNEQLLMNGKDLLDSKTLTLSTLSTPLTNITNGAQLNDHTIIYQDQQYHNYIVSFDSMNVTIQEIQSLPNDELELFSDGSGKVYACLTNTHLKKCEIYSIYFE